MTTHPTTIDISTMPELRELVEEVEAIKTPQKLTRDNKVVAILTLAPVT